MSNHTDKLNHKTPSWLKWLSHIGYECPHSDCQKHFRLPFNKNGLLFCPHCKRSLLSQSPNVDIYSPTNKNDKTHLSFQWQYLTHIRYWYLSIIILSVAIIFRWLSIGAGIFWLITIPAGLFFAFLIAKSVMMKGKHDFTVLVTHNKKPFYAGADTLADMTRMPFRFVAPNGKLMINQDANRDIFTYYKDVNCCPFCNSQRLINISQQLILNSQFFEKYGISRPRQIPKSGFDPVSKTYIDHNKYAYILCMRCHSYFKWQKNTRFSQADADSKRLITSLSLTRSLGIALAVVSFLMLFAVYAFFFPGVINISYFYLIEDNSMFTFEVFSKHWWQASVETLPYLMLSLAIIQFTVFLYSSYFKWKPQNKFNSVSLKKVDVDY